MNELVVIVAQYLIYVVALVAAVVWLRAPRAEKPGFAVQGVLAVLLMLVLVKVAGMVHTDPRPFVVNPHLKPLFPHPADNGFPSDHTAITSAVAFVVMVHRRLIGLGLLVLSVLIGLSRVAAHVHHLQDIVAAVVIGGVAAAIAVGLWALAAPRLTRAGSSGASLRR